MKFILLRIIKLYQKNISPYTVRKCRFLPTCSDYFYQAVLKYGFFKGSYLGIKRLLKCHPFHKGGYDPVGFKVQSTTIKNQNTKNEA